MPFYSKNSGPILITSCSYEKKYQVLLAYTFSCSGAGEPGNEATCGATVSHGYVPCSMYSFMSSVCYRREKRRGEERRGEERRGEGGREGGERGAPENIFFPL